MDDRIARIRGKLEASGKLLNPPLNLGAVEAFEQAHKILLPEAYREFLLKLGNGGQGPPSYGVPRLGEPADDMDSEQKAFWTELPRIKQPFPYQEAWIWEEEDDADPGTRAQIGAGSLYVGNDGCGMYWHLIVTGPERGQVWSFADIGIMPTIPGRDFLQWYEDWLDGVEFWPTVDDDF